LLGDVAEARLILSEALIRQSLRVAKASQGQDASMEDGARKVPPGEGAEPRRGPGRGVRSNFKQAKSNQAKLPALQSGAASPETGDKDGSQRQ
jgi:ribosome maturation factor RimP